jgi:hypothetical protein
MLRTLAKASMVAVLMFGGIAHAQVTAEVVVAAPTIHFDVAPPLVVVSPGVMVVQDYGEEIFFTGGWYWYRSGPIWYRTHDFRGGWVVAPRGYVPARLVRLPPGQYRHFRAGPGHPMYRPMRVGPRAGGPVYAGGGRFVHGDRGYAGRGYAGRGYAGRGHFRGHR